MTSYEGSAARKLAPTRTFVSSQPKRLVLEDIVHEKKSWDNLPRIKDSIIGYATLGAIASTVSFVSYFGPDQASIPLDQTLGVLGTWGGGLYAKYAFAQAIMKSRQYVSALHDKALDFTF